MGKKVSVNVQPGYVYKNLVKDQYIAKLIDVTERIKGILITKFGMADNDITDNCVEDILNIYVIGCIKDKIVRILSPYLNNKNLIEYFVTPKNGEIVYIDEKITPSDLTFFDHCMWSGHILVYAFDVLMEI